MSDNSQPLVLWSKEIKDFLDHLGEIRVGQVRLHKHGYKIKIVSEGVEIFNGKRTNQKMFRLYEIGSDRRRTWNETGFWVLDRTDKIL